MAKGQHTHFFNKIDRLERAAMAREAQRERQKNAPLPRTETKTPAPATLDHAAQIAVFEEWARAETPVARVSKPAQEPRREERSATSHRTIQRGAPCGGGGRKVGGSKRDLALLFG
ncbi:MAG: hypothetical protein A2848_01475 [Candidatus Magasanikbacteria bacterium RIFCSPHIGHO2_01_FULL_50_8]|uniref:Uncharacterized protein n=1 Tax=Candidatus Magasanikbacteria bacterium RIFCSPHIGHO2_01_FULL_50_8 TaxID=1798674 RepID=A0A1F6LRZ2_9BACT|nr:MAG: hypothetical protein A2848_01475 [Candidatus Magasanikbacteria bacterium RIFCSPHIGHO2_01_FULL_50_8]